MGQMNKTKIEYCDYTWNPVSGCLHGCPYCYARRIAERFDTFDKNPNLVISEFKKWHREENPIAQIVVDEPIKYVQKGKKVVTSYPFGFTPTFHRFRLDEPQRVKKPSTIFVCSMGDLFGDFIPDEWIREVFKACEAAPQHRYLFLTKNPLKYNDINHLVDLGRWASCDGLYGASASNDYEAWLAYQSDADWISIEPIHEAIDSWRFFYPPPINERRWEWVVIGAETGNRKEKVMPEREWIEEIVDTCDSWGTPVFMKNSLRQHMGDDFRQEWPEGLGGKNENY